MNFEDTPKNHRFCGCENNFYTRFFLVIPTVPSTEKQVVDKKTTLKVVLAVSSIIVAALLVAMYIIKRRKSNYKICQMFLSLFING